MKLIDSEELKKIILTSPVWTGLDAIARINAIPTIDIVFCKECKYKRIYDGETKYYYCALEDRPNRQWSIDEMDYCSWAERSSDEQ